MLEVKIESSEIKLDQVLKLSAILQSGGQAKHFIQDGLVKVNGQVETQRSRKIKAGDIIDIENIDSFIVI